MARTTKKPAAKSTTEPQRTATRLERACIDAMAHYVNDWIVDWRARLEKMGRIVADMAADIEANPHGRWPGTSPRNSCSSSARG